MNADILAKQGGPSIKSSHARDGDALHHDGCLGVVIGGRHLADLLEELHALDALAKHWMLGLTGREPIQVGIVGHVDEELRASAVGLTSVRHGQSARCIGIAGNVLVLDVTAVAALLRCAGLQILEGAIWRTASAGATALGILSIWASELVHETWDDTMKVNSIVEA